MLNNSNSLFLVGKIKKNIRDSIVVPPFPRIYLFFSSPDQYPGYVFFFFFSITLEDLTKLIRSINTIGHCVISIIINSLTSAQAPIYFKQAVFNHLNQRQQQIRVQNYRPHLYPVVFPRVLF